MKKHYPSFYVISTAVDGNLDSIERILHFYDSYISKCCLRPYYDRYGNVCIVVDMELKGRIREAIIQMIYEFELEKPK
ncbi:MAG TPA: helix-turn-helix domain-containing protein [Lachnospiraceae bacterium]